MAHEPIPPETWLRQAREELHAARALLADEGSPPRIACFLAHLVAEKAIKALLVSRDQPVPRTHVLVALVAELPAELQELFDRDELQALTPWAVAGRYGELAGADGATAARLVEAAARTLGAAEKALRDGEAG